MPSPYNTDPPSGQIQNLADSYFFGFEGLYADAGVQANLTTILADGVGNGIIAALTNASVKTALKEVICDGMSDGYDKILVNHPDGLLVDITPNGIEEALVDAITNLVDNKIISGQYDDYLQMYILSNASDNGSVYLSQSNGDSLDAMLDDTRSQTAETILTNP